MSETPAENPTPATPAEAPQGDPVEALGEPGKKALAAEREARKAAEKSAADLAAKLKEIEAAQMSDLERAQAAAKEYQEAAAKASSEALRWRIAAKHGISDEDAEVFLTGADEDTLTRQAERLSALSTAGGPPTPKPDATQGARGNTLDPVATAQPGPQRLAAAFEQQLSANK